jgi:tol-pal system protein YbgF
MSAALARRVVLAVAVAAYGCAGGSGLERENEELRRLLRQTQGEIEELRRDQEELRASVEYIEGAPPGAQKPAQPPAGQWPTDPWSSPDRYSSGEPSVTDAPSASTAPQLEAPVADGTGQAGMAVEIPTRADEQDAAAAIADDRRLPAEAPAATVVPGATPGTSDIVASVRGTGGTAPAPAARPAPPPPVPDKLRDTLYDQAVQAFADERYDEAIQSFRDFIHKEPQSAWADDAQYWIGESNLRKGLYSSAIKEFNQVVLRYASGDRSAGALLKLAEVFSKIGDRVDARLSLQRLVNRYPGSAEAAEAYKLLQEMGG